jgi:hypothetical protein
MESNQTDVIKQLYITELDNAQHAVSVGNIGKARVCCRRAIGVVVSNYTSEYGSDAMNIVNNLAKNVSGVLPDEIQEYAIELARGFRHELHGHQLESNPINITQKIIDYFIGKHN